MKRFLIAAVLIADVHVARAQQPTFKAGVELVTVPVTVTSLDHNTYIEGLTPADFRLSENGVRQEISLVSRERAPLSLCIVVDSSGSMGIGNRRELAVEAAQRTIAGLLPEDEIAVVFFSKRPEVRVPWIRIADIGRLNWGGWNPIGYTTLIDGMTLGLEMIQSARHRRRAVLLLSDGFENSSKVSLADVVKTRQQSETAIFGFGVGSSKLSDLANDQPHVRTRMGPASTELLRGLDPVGGGPSKPATALPDVDYLDVLVGDSGGTVTRMLSMPEAAMAARNLLNELRYEYLVAYTPKKPLDGKYRKLKVEVNRRGLYVRHRGGYLAMPSAP